MEVMKNKQNTKKSRTQWNEAWRRLRKNKMAMTGLYILLIIVLLAIFADFIADYQNDAIQQNLRNRLQSSSSDNIFGTDSFGRDIFARVLFGARVSLFIGFFVTVAAILIGGIFGSVAGYFGGRIDNIIMRVTDVFLAIPDILMAIAVVAALGQGLFNLIIAMIISFIPPYTRLVRSLVLTIKDNEYVEAARAIGARVDRIILLHILPNAMGPLIVQATLTVGRIIIIAAGLSFLGLGVSPPDPEWGFMLSEGKEFMRHYPHLVLFPGLAIMLVVLSLNLLGDGLNDALDPRLK
ncbi:MAG: ABC transporter permease [Clostridia bacterium]|jgi:peptide/nickel transport system permease protein|nr:ABC transporter permease [Clostridia bacterium]